MEIEEVSHGGSATSSLLALHNLLARHLLVEEHDHASVTRWIIDANAYSNHLYSSLCHLSRDLEVAFTPHIPSSSSLDPSTSLPIPLNSSSPSTVYVVGHTSPTGDLKDSFAHLMDVQYS